MFSIHSVNSERTLTFSSYRNEKFQIEFKGSDVYGSIGVWESNYVQSLDAFFEELAGFTKPWQGTRKWESFEGELSLSATCATLGQVTFLVEIRHRTVAPEPWFVQAAIVTELGQLEKIASEAKTFFQKASA